MESSDLLNCAIRVKQESSHVSLVQNYSEMIDEKPDLKNFKLLSFSPENSNHTLQKCEENHGSELDDEVEIVVECEDVKPNFDILAVKKIDDYSPNHLRNVIDSDDKTLNVIKIEPPGEVKKEIICDVTEESNLKLDYLKIHIDTLHNGVTHTCDICGKIFRFKSRLKVHIDSVHHSDITS
uniref:C2H2-type domain-containing protein n=1 Tax=Trichogramma kaykai TaxID=54128 RepID=A0ABD2VWL3_9HYME